ncbi:hypothetical protein A3E15_03035 [Candidatus Woesebacteria bacterium RIFCSPHIGHO2_12_FULL_42_9]|uniref:Uncharacterized protein n=3 Tax=Candidatus Woeseibacteriota TaxID=1752722 RepID=A0A1F8AVP9_9BACT|nr:MAG: hypothetical protein UT23_C0018G0004 [Candidatus Woesebacteria bacterium GW2011_GWA1_39_12]OGM06302.1 MAG: hypothetical protein A2129_01190 [Candidatus Woesebacteria bacterium GWC1_42_13]OGM55710.1 MAG: hypothetical protein A3E15_03035 [Candidatus Woesebacteria bacterium RIFCSPHIGHO2_12_FULL_42_9]
MKVALKIAFLLLSLGFLLYLYLPSPEFPEQLDDAYVSNEPADVETPLRRGYYTDYGRNEVLAHYQEEFNKSNFFEVPLPTYRLNYPPEEAQTLIRDQARSTFLEEIVHPFRESIFVNGFEPKLAQDAIKIDEKDWRQKVIVRYVPSNLGIRLLIGFLTLGLTLLISKNLYQAAIDIKKELK